MGHRLLPLTTAAGMIAETFEAWLDVPAITDLAAQMSTNGSIKRC